MTTRLPPTGARAKRSIDTSAANSLAWTVFAPLLTISGVIIVAALPQAFALTALSILMVAGGFALASGLCLAGLRKHRGASDAWTIAGALVFLGFAAGILTDIEEALAALEQLQMRRLANR